VQVFVVYESLFGCTRDVAGAVSAGLRGWPGAAVACVPVAGAAHDLAGVDLLVVGGPTHLLGMASTLSWAMESQYERRILRSRPGSRRMVSGTYGIGLRRWLAQLPPAPDVPAAVFDTRVDALVAGGAASGMARRLRRRGHLLVSSPQTFVVEGIAGPLAAGELDRAATWGMDLGRQLQAVAARG
jgi:hypothetical protein